MPSQPMSRSGGEKEILVVSVHTPISQMTRAGVQKVLSLQRCKHSERWSFADITWSFRSDFLGDTGQLCLRSVWTAELTYSLIIDVLQCGRHDDRVRRQYDDTETYRPNANLETGAIYRFRTSSRSRTSSTSMRRSPRAPSRKCPAGESNQEQA
jgi:hypothetical protein